MPAKRGRGRGVIKTRGKPKGSIGKGSPKAGAQVENLASQPEANPIRVEELNTHKKAQIPLQKEKPTESTPTRKELQLLNQKRQKVSEELQAVEKQCDNFKRSLHTYKAVPGPKFKCMQIYDLETRYLENSHPHGNAIKGYEGLLTQGNQTSSRRTVLRPEDRLFSNSSIGDML